MNEKALRKKISQICWENNIPLFATDLMQGFPKRFMKTLDKEKSVDSLAFLDFSYQKLIENTEDNFRLVHIKPLYELYAECNLKSKKVGYAWSKIEDKQYITNQINALKKAGCKRLIIEFTGNYEALRPKLEKLLGSLKYGDTLVICKMISLGLTFE